MSFNTTNGVNQTGNLSRLTTHHLIPTNNAQRLDNSLGYGLGKVARSAFDALANAWQQIWSHAPSFEEQTQRKAETIYQMAGSDTQKRSLQQTGTMPASFDLSTLDGTNGFAVQGLAAGDWLGSSVSTAGDLTGDGLADLVLGAYWASPGGLYQAGCVYVMFGQATGWPGQFNLTSLNGTNGFAVQALAAGDNLGTSVSTAGDITSDGLDDLVLGANFASPDGLSYAGSVYVLFGKATGWSGQFNLTSLNGTNGFAVQGLTASDYLGASVSTAGNLTGDDLADLVLGADGTSPDGETHTGRVYVLFGKAASWPGQFNLTNLNGTNGFAAQGLAASDYLGYSVSTAGDLTGDGLADLVLGTNAASPDGLSQAGSAYVLFGQATGWPGQFNLTSLNGTNGFAVQGLAAGDYLGSSVSTAGDLNGDGLADLVLGAYWANPGGLYQAGSAYVLFGKATGWPGQFNLTILNGTDGFVVQGLAAGDNLGYSVSTAGDLTGDGLADLVLGAAGASPDGLSNAGSAYVLFGQATGWPGQFNLTSLNGTNGFAVQGLAAGDELGSSVSTAGDLNGDGLDDLVLGAWAASPGGLDNAGSVYIIFGKNSSFASPAPLPTSPPTPLLLSPSLANVTVPPPPNNLTTIGIGVGIGGAVLLGGVVGLIVFLKLKKKACFADKETARQRDLKLKDEELGSLPVSLDESLFIPQKNIAIEQKIAEGSFGDISRGIWQGHTVAIKQLKGQFSETAQTNLFTEIKIMAGLRSPYVITFYGVTREQPYRIVMQYMEGGSLRNLLKKQPVETTPWSLRFQIGHDISEGLTYLHERKIAHADLKSLNVLLDKENHAQLADFGLATIKQQNEVHQQAASIQGSLLWMAPELFNNVKPNFASDVFSLGVVLWEMATHRLPFQEFKWSAKEIATQLQQGRRETFPTGTPDVYRDIAQNCWESEPAKRPTAEAVAAIFATLWGKEERTFAQVSQMQDPTYLAGTVALQGGTFIGNAQTQFGI